jgi:hypothetical protein
MLLTFAALWIAAGFIPTLGFYIAYLIERKSYKLNFEDLWTVFWMTILGVFTTTIMTYAYLRSWYLNRTKKGN